MECLLWVTLAAVAGTGAVARRPSRRILQGWKACRFESVVDLKMGCPATAGPLMNVSSLPTTALLVLLENQRIPGLEHLLPDDIYFSNNLALLPDISDVKRGYYTLAYQYDFVDQLPSRRNYSNRQILRVSGVNYRALAYLDGKPLKELSHYPQQQQRLSSADEFAWSSDGMFRRRYYNVTGGGRFLLVIEPPLHPGNPSTGGQGGNHALAQDGPTAQFMLGWDWCQAMPDRATGFYGAVTLYHEPLYAPRILDPTIQTVQIECDNTSNVRGSSPCTKVVLAVLARLECEHCPGDQATITVTIESDWNETWSFSLLISSGEGSDVYEEFEVTQPERVNLWWPHGIGEEFEVAHLHSFSLRTSFSSGNKEWTAPEVSTTIEVGIRTVSTYLDETLQAQTFMINGHRMYLVGGNWITPDQALRYSASSERYCQELALHVYAGLNLIRVWGGGVAETDDFYQCADRLGLLIYQEFWMTGDNNGRWAGRYSWPLDYTTYLSNVEDTIRRLRVHASLLFYAGCNECLAPRSSKPWFPNPPREIDDGIRSLLKTLDPDRFYISSSMGGRNVADTFEDETLWANRSYSLAYADGPYGILLPWAMFQRNPGLNVSPNVKIGFQPEIGNVGAPTYQGVLRFMKRDEVDVGFPRNGATEAGTIWGYHKFLPWVTSINKSVTYDHVYSYFGPNHPVDASEWCAAAQLAVHSQYQNMINAFISHAFEYTSAVILWKTQSPWPALRGFLYDWYLESTGSLRGVRAALENPISIVFDPTSWRLRVVNRKLIPLTSSETVPVGAKYTWVDLTGRRLFSKTIVLPCNSVVPPMSTMLLGSEDDAVSWLNDCGQVCFLALQVIAPGRTNSLQSLSSTASWLWITDPKQGIAGDFSALGDLRLQSKGFATSLNVTGCALFTYTTQVTVRITTGRDILFYPTLFLFATDRRPINPVFDSHDTKVVLLPSSTQLRQLETPGTVFPEGTALSVTLRSWNGVDITEKVVCQAANPATEQ